MLATPLSDNIISMAVLVGVVALLFLFMVGLKSVSLKWRQIEVKLSNVDRQINNRHSQATTVSQDVTSIVASLGALDTRFTNLDARFTALDARGAGNHSLIALAAARIEDVGRAVSDLTALSSVHDVRLQVVEGRGTAGDHKA